MVICVLNKFSFDFHEAAWQGVCMRRAQVLSGRSSARLRLQSLSCCLGNTQFLNSISNHEARATILVSNKAYINHRSLLASRRTTPSRGSFQPSCRSTTAGRPVGRRNITECIPHGDPATTVGNKHSNRALLSKYYKIQCIALILFEFTDILPATFLILNRCIAGGSYNIREHLNKNVSQRSEQLSEYKLILDEPPDDGAVDI
mmetsp:Transcript_49935/g.63969  ORF Transcript_49935/g.63969 Transcript_49935/m.63969 type:complete len:203 (-) Transcript_49935:294-902(-)